VHSGYRFEEHKVLTDDGYILTAYRIPGPMRDGDTDQVLPKKGPALLQHGLLDEGGTWFFNDQPLPFHLADLGYDVWVSNSRGTTASNEHRYFASPQQKVRRIEEEKDDEEERYAMYWNFTVHEMAEFDLPAMVNYIVEESGEEQLIYMGHS
jgi:pimeloyl-ACP methyl ester carboxylesterase